MSKFCAKVRLIQEKSAEILIRAFFKDFNSESSIEIIGEEAKLEIVFQQPPMEIIEAINYCKVIELNCGKNLEEHKEDEIVKVETEKGFEQKNEDCEKFELAEQNMVESENSEQNERKVAESEIFEQTEQPKKKRSRPETRKVEPMEEAKPDSTLINIPELEEIAKKSTSFEHFAKLVAEWLEMDKRQELFTNLVIVSAEVDKITLADLERTLNSKNISWKDWDKIWIRRKISKKLEKYSVTMLPFLKATRRYKEYSFSQVDEYSTEENFTELVTENTMNNVEEKVEKFAESLITKPRVKMECMPEIKEFEEILVSVDKTQPVEERVHYVLEAMGLNMVSVKEQKQIVEIASVAVRKGRMTFDIIFADTNIPSACVMEARIAFSKFVNDFVQKYESDKKVKLLTFLSELQKIIMVESEIENFSDCTN